MLSFFTAGSSPFLSATAENGAPTRAQLCEILRCRLASLILFFTSSSLIIKAHAGQQIHVAAGLWILVVVIGARWSLALSLALALLATSLRLYWRLETLAGVFNVLDRSEGCG